MKRLLIAAFLLTGMAMSAQEGPEISSAVIAIDRNNDLKAAKEFLDKATEIINGKDLSTVSYKDLRKYYFYMGEVHFRILNSPDEAIRSLDANALDKAAENFRKTIEYEKSTGKSPRYTDQAQAQLFNCAIEYYKKGIALADKQEFGASADAFETCFNLKKSELIGQFSAVDTSALLNAAIMAENGSQQDKSLLDKAIGYNQMLLDMGYKGITHEATMVENGEVVQFPNKQVMEGAVAAGKVKDPKSGTPITSELYKSLYRLNLAKGDTVAYKAALAKGRELFPGDEQFIRLELQEYLDAKDYEKAMKNLDLALQQDPDNKMFYYIKGFIYQTEVKDLDKALEAYAKALEIDPSYMEVLYMSGLVHVDKANAITEKMNKLGLNEKKKYDALKAEQKAAFEKALPMFEKAHEVNPDDMDTIKALKEVYYKLGMAEKSLEMNKLLQGQ